jgi:hypothetical protein
LYRKENSSIPILPIITYNIRLNNPFEIANAATMIPKLKEVRCMIR